MPDHTLLPDHYRQIFDRLPESALILAPDAPEYTVLDANAAFLRLVNAPKDDLRGRPIRALFPPAQEGRPNHGEAVLASLEIAVQTKEEQVMTNFRFDVINPSTGELDERYWITHNTPVLDERGEIAFLLHSPRNVTETYKMSEQRIQKLMTLVDNSVDLMSILEFTGFNSYLNAAGCKMLGFESEQEMLETPIATLHAPEDFAQVEREVIPSVMNEGRWSGTMMVRHRQTGERFPVLNNCIRIDDPVSGVPMAVGAVMRDLRPEIAAVAEIKAQAEHLLLATTAAQLGTFDLDVKTGTLEWDTRCRELFGISSDRPLAYSEDFVQGLHPDDRQRVTAIIDEVFDRARTDGNYDVEYRTVGFEDPKTRWLRAKGKAFFNERDEPVRFIGTVLEITDKKLEEIRKNDFIAMVSHELKTPLTSIKSYIQLLLARAGRNADGTTAHMLQRAHAQTEKMVGLINGFLDISRLENGRMRLERSSFDLGTLLADTASEIAALHTSHRIDVQSPVGLLVSADREKMGQVLLNLLNNAIKYSPPGSHVEVGAHQINDLIEIWVTDRGIGIRPEHKDRLFERFYRVDDTPMQAASGFGIGLYLVSEIVSLHRGSVNVESKPGEGSTFRVTIPADEKD